MNFALRLLTVSLLLLALVALAGGRQAAAQNLAALPASDLHTDCNEESAHVVEHTDPRQPSRRT
jgi:hypothetical protein